MTKILEDAISANFSEICENYINHLIAKHRGDPGFMSEYMRDVLSPVFAPLVKAPDDILVEMAVHCHNFIDHAEEITRELAKEEANG